MKLERWLARHDGAGRRRARQWVLDGRVCVDGKPVVDHCHEVGRFQRIELDGCCVQEAQRRIGIMLYKPSGVLSATRDARFQTVLDLVDDPDRDGLHLVGRLDRASSGLVLLTNDGNWSKALMHPDRKVPKVYEVETDCEIAADAAGAFERGFYFHTEDITTLPVGFERLGPCRARLTLHEGRYHQIKRMFHRLGNRVVSLHRTSVGALVLPDDWEPGEWRCLTPEEMDGAAENGE